MKLTINITMENDAFTDAPGQEAARILRELADRLQAEVVTDSTSARFPLRDVSGNAVGQAVVRS